MPDDKKDVARSQRAETWIGHWEIIAATGELYWSEDVYRIHGMNPDNGIDLDAAINAYHPDDRTLVFEYVRRALEEREDYQFDLRLIRSDGDVRNVRSTGIARIGADGEVASVFGVFQDITEFKRTEERLQKSEANLAKAQRLAQLGSWALDLETGDTIWSDEQYRIFGYEPGEITPSLDFVVAAIHEDDQPRFHETVNHAIKSEITGYVHEYRIIRPDGTERYLQSTVEVERDENGTATGLTGIYQDITTRHQTELALKESDARFQTFFDHSPTLMSLKDADGKYQMVNRSWERLFNRRGDTIVGKRPKDILPAHVVECSSLHDQVTKESLRESLIEENIHIGDVSRTLLTLKFPVLDGDGQFQNVGAVSTDITEQKTAEKAMRDSSARLIVAVRLAGLGYCTWDVVNDVCSYCSDEYAQMHGFTTKEYESRPSIFTGGVDLTHPDDKVRYREACDRLRLGHGFDLEYRIITPAGATRWIHQIAEPVVDEGGPVIEERMVAQDVTDKKLAEDALNRSELNYRQLFENAAVGIGRTSMEDSRVIQANNKLAEMFGYDDVDEFISEYIFVDHYVNIADRERLLASYKQSPNAPIECEFTRRDGSIISLQVHPRPNQTTLVLSFVAIDISKQKRLEKAQRDSEGYIRALIDSNPSAIFLKDLDGRYVLINSAYEDLISLSRDDIIGKTVAELGLFDDDYVKEIEEFDAEVMRTRVPIQREHFPRLPGGREPATVLIKYPIFDVDGAPIGTGSMETDITDRKVMEIDLRESRRRLADILELAPEGIISTDGDLCITLFNKGAERMFGFGADEVLGQPLALLMPERFAAQLHDQAETFANSGTEFQLMDERQEITGRRKDETEFPASASISRVETDSGNIYTVIVHDITDRKLAEESLKIAKGEAEIANEAKSDFLAAMSHELRTPLNAILGFANIISQQYLGPLGVPKYKEYADDIHDSGVHLLSLVDDLLDISTIEAGKLAFHREQIGVAEIVGESLATIGQAVTAKNISLINQVTGDVPKLYAGKRAMKQILLNLLGNALRYTPEYGSITVSIDDTIEQMTLVIADTGRGIPRHLIPELTKPFVRAEQDPYQSTEGWGLGLSITQSLIDLHDGRLAIESEVGKGTVVSVSIPRTAP